jgi:hypothetical protein
MPYGTITAAEHRFQQLRAILQADGSATPRNAGLEQARREWIAELAGPKYGKWWLHNSEISHADLLRVLNRTADDDDAQQLRARVLEWAASHLEDFEERRRAKRDALKARALVRHYRVMIKGEPALPERFPKMREAFDAAAQLWWKHQRPVSVFQYREDWPGSPALGYLRIWEYYETTLESRRDLVYRSANARLEPGEDPNALVQVGQSVCPPPITPTLEWLEDDAGAQHSYPLPAEFDEESSRKEEPTDLDVRDLLEEDDDPAPSRAELEARLHAISKDLESFNPRLLLELAEFHDWKSHHCYSAGHPRNESPCDDCHLQHVVAGALRAAAERETRLVADAIPVLLRVPDYALDAWYWHVLNSRVRCNDCAGAPWLEDEATGHQTPGCERCELVLCTSAFVGTALDCKEAQQ